MKLIQRQNIESVETKISLEGVKRNGNGKYTETVGRLQKAW